LHDQLKLLEDLQQVDVELEETEKELAGLPKKLQSLKDDVAIVERLLDSERAQLAEAQSYKAERGAELKAEQDLLQKSKSKMSQVRTSKEYLAIQREFEANRRATGERQDEISKLNEAVDQFQTSIGTHEGELATLLEHVAQEEEETARRIAELNATAELQRQRREQMTSDIRKDILRKYNTIRRRRAGVAVVEASRGVCTGCNMQVPPQLYNIIQRGTSIEQCPNCHRIIYYHDPDAVAAREHAKADGPEAEASPEAEA